MSTEWGDPSALDGLDPPGEQLELPWDGDAPRAAELVETTVHRVTWSVYAWHCACGSGRTWRKDAGGQPRGAALRHMQAVRRRLGI